MMQEWTLGITDTPPSTWPTCSPHWTDETLIASSSHTFYDLMDKLCNSSAIQSRREYDYGVEDHLWNIRIMSLEECCRRPETPEERLLRLLGRNDDDDSGEDDSMDDDNEDKYRGKITLQCPAEAQRREYQQHFNDDGDDSEEVQLLDSTNTKLSTNCTTPPRIHPNRHI